MLDRCENCSRPGRGIYHPGQCPGMSARDVGHVISPFPRDDKDRQIYARSNYVNAPGHSSPWGRDPNPGAYGQRPKPLRVSKNGRVSVFVKGR